jgi:hypothetical protein
MANANVRFACRQTEGRRPKTFEFRLAIPRRILASVCEQNCDCEKLDQKKFKL